MNRLSTLALLASLASANAADPQPSEADRLKVVEKQLAELKKEVSDLREQLKASPKPASKNKLIGNWGMDKPPDAKFEGVVALELKEDGTFNVVTQGKSSTGRASGTYTVVGKVVELESSSALAFTLYLHVVSVDEKELVVKARAANKEEFTQEGKLQRQ